MDSTESFLILSDDMDIKDVANLNAFAHLRVCGSPCCETVLEKIKVCAACQYRSYCVSFSMFLFHFSPIQLLS